MEQYNCFDIVEAPLRDPDLKTLAEELLAELKTAAVRVALGHGHHDSGSWEHVAREALAQLPHDRREQAVARLREIAADQASRRRELGVFAEADLAAPRLLTDAQPSMAARRAADNIRKRLAAHRADPQNETGAPPQAATIDGLVLATATPKSAFSPLADIVRIDAVRQAPLPDRIALQTDNGHYVCAEAGGGDRVVADRPHVRSWETFTLVPLGGDQVALQAHDGQYVCAEAGGGGRMVADRARISTWETFQILRYGERVAFKTHNGHYLSASNGGGGDVLANAQWALPQRLQWRWR